MPESPNRSQAESPSLARGLFRALPLESETARFVLVSALDLIVTSLMIQRSGFVEANPVALYFLNHWGLRGLVWFKMGMVAFIAALAQVIARQRPETARRVLDLATVVVGAVVIYSLVLMIRHGGAPQ